MGGISKGAFQSDSYRIHPAPDPTKAIKSFMQNIAFQIFYIDVYSKQDKNVQ